MAKAKKTTTDNPSNKQVITMPEAGSVPTIRKAVSASSPTPIDLDDQIRRRAYELYEERGRTPGFENEDWLRAEHEIRNGKAHSQSA
jgi:predicted PP-loop superfamily ATPase